MRRRIAVQIHSNSNQLKNTVPLWKSHKALVYYLGSTIFIIGSWAAIIFAIARST